MAEQVDKYAKTRQYAQIALAKIRAERVIKEQEREIAKQERAKDNSPFTDEEISIAERAIDRRVSNAARSAKKPLEE